MEREKLIKQLFAGKVSEIIGDKKTIELLREATEAVDESIRYRQNLDNANKNHGKTS